jgi:long-chain acyl-CoA synthetase
MVQPSSQNTPHDVDPIARAALQGMVVAYVAARAPNKLAVASPFGERTFAQLNARVNQLARLLRQHGIGEGDSMALVSKNRPAFVEAYLAALRTGVRFTPVNFHLTAEEVGYVIDDCEASVVIYDGTLPTAAEAVARAPRARLKLIVGGADDGLPNGFIDYDAALAPLPGHDIDDPVRGTQMLYTSGTTGRPKGVYRRQQPVQRSASQVAAAWNLESDLCLCTGPGYHAAPLAFNIAGPLNAGVGVVFMDKWDAEETLRLVEEHRVTHTHMVATMFHRLLQLPEPVRAKYDLSSLRFVIHGAAPTPVHVKRAMIDWLGPVVYEYYAATEGGGNYFVTPQDWLRKPGTVGRSPTPELTKILDDDGNEVPQGQSGTLYFKAPEIGRFEYFKAPDKTAQSYRDDWFTLGDMGYLDEDGYLFLNGRNAETIISGGVNIYPHEVDSELLQHPAVADVCTVGVPNEEWGEEVKSVVQLASGHAGSAALAAELIAFARSRLPGFKVPRSIDFAADLPRLPSGKIQRRLVRAPYWAGRTRQI